MDIFNKASRNIRNWKASYKGRLILRRVSGMSLMITLLTVVLSLMGAPVLKAFTILTLFYIGLALFWYSLHLLLDKP